MRNSVALSALLRKPVSIQKIRNGRRPPGLKAQHEAGEDFKNHQRGLTTIRRLRVEVGRGDLLCSDKWSPQGFIRGRLLSWSHPPWEEVRCGPWNSRGNGSLASGFTSLPSVLPTHSTKLEPAGHAFPHDHPRLGGMDHASAPRRYKCHIRAPSGLHDQHLPPFPRPPL